MRRGDRQVHERDARSAVAGRTCNGAASPGNIGGEGAKRVIPHVYPRRRETNDCITVGRSLDWARSPTRSAVASGSRRSRPVLDLTRRHSLCFPTPFRACRGGVAKPREV